MQGPVRGFIGVMGIVATMLLGANGLGGPQIFAAERILVPSADTVLFANNPTNNLGASDLLAIGATGKGFPARSLVRFDLASSLPAGSVILDARLEIQVMRGPGGDAFSPVRAHRMRVAWEEGRGKGNLGELARTGEPTWTHRRFPDLPWSSPGAGRGVEFAETPSGSTVMNALGVSGITGPGILEDVKAWLASPETNQGWILVSEGEETKLTARRVGSRESIDPGAVPKLVLVLGEAPTLHIDHWKVQDGRIEIGFRADAGHVFEVQYRDSTTSGLGAWNVLTNFPVKLQSTDVVVSDAVRESGARWYRVADVGDVD